MQLLSNRPVTSSTARIAPSIEVLEHRLLLTAVVVNSTSDVPGPTVVTLRQAVAEANASKTPTTITFDPKVFATAKTITLTSGLSFTNSSEPTTIMAPAVGVTLNSGNQDVGLSFATGTTTALTNVSLVNGVGGQAGVTNNGKTTFTNATFSGNGGAGGGGAIYNPAGTLKLIDSTFSGNFLTGSGGGAIDNLATAILINVTISGNTTASGAGAILNPGTLSLFDCTIAGNTSKSGVGAISGSGTCTLANTIIAGNTESAGNSDVGGAFKSLGYNLIGKSDGSTGWTAHDHLGTIAHPLSAKLGPLAANGGPTKTMLPLAGSPAINAGSNALVPAGITTDQRGLPRIFGTVDIGAVEVQPSIVIAAPAKQTATVGSSASVKLGSFTQSNATSPFKLDIKWGDGSADTLLTLPAAGTIPATAHIFAKAGSLTVTETITDAKGAKSNVASFTDVVSAVTGSISGRVFNDVNSDGKVDNGEAGLGLFIVDLENSGNKILAAATTNVLGNFTFAGLAAGTYIIKVVPVPGLAATKPTNGTLTITLAAGQNSTGSLFGERATS